MMQHAEFEERTVDVDGERVAFLQAGEGPPLVFVTDEPDGALTGGHTLLAEHYQVFAFGLASGAHPGPMIVGALGRLGHPRFNLWGDWAALCLALEAPDAVEALVLEAPQPPAEHEADLASLQVPTLVVFGTRDSIVPPETGQTYREKLPNGHYVLVYDAGHTPSADRPEAFVSLVRDFLTRREAFIVSNRSSLLHP